MNRSFITVITSICVVFICGCNGTQPPPAPPPAPPDVTGLSLVSVATVEETVVLEWDEVIFPGLDGYRVYFRVNDIGANYVYLESTSAITYTDNSTSRPSGMGPIAAGRYAVKAYNGTNYSENYSNSVSTMPELCPAPVEIWAFSEIDSVENSWNGFIFEPEYSSLGYAWNPLFLQDIYCYPGVPRCAIYSGNELPFHNGGKDTELHLQSGLVYSYPEDTSSPQTALDVHTDDVVFCKLTVADQWVKMYIEDAELVHPIVPDLYGIRFHYEYQHNSGLYLFTTYAN